MIKFSVNKIKVLCHILITWNVHVKDACFNISGSNVMAS